MGERRSAPVFGNYERLIGGELVQVVQQAGHFLDLGRVPPKVSIRAKDIGDAFGCLQTFARHGLRELGITRRMRRIETLRVLVELAQHGPHVVVLLVAAAALTLRRLVANSPQSCRRVVEALPDELSELLLRAVDELS